MQKFLKIIPGSIGCVEILLASRWQCSSTESNHSLPTLFWDDFTSFLKWMMSDLIYLRGGNVKQKQNVCFMKMLTRERFCSCFDIIISKYVDCVTIVVFIIRHLTVFTGSEKKWHHLLSFTKAWKLQTHIALFWFFVFCLICLFIKHQNL